MLSFFTSRRRRKLRALPPQPAWEGLLRQLPFYNRLPAADRRELIGHMHVLMTEKAFEGAGGLAISGKMKVLITAQAALLLLHRPTDYYPRLGSIIVYPGSFIAPRRTRHGGWLESERNEILDGESWGAGAVVLSWAQVQASAAEEDGINLVMHEFAHQLDEEDGVANGAPVLGDHVEPAEWARVMRDEFQALRDAEERGEVTLLDPYGAESPAEFFAVATETFFELGFDLSVTRPTLYEQLKAYYQQDPARW